MARKHIIAPLTVEEAYTPGHEGMLSFLEITPDEARQRNEGVHSTNDRGSLKDRGAPNGRVSGYDSGSPSDVYEPDARESSDERRRSEDGGSPDDRGPAVASSRPQATHLHLAPVRGESEGPKRKVKVQQCSRVQDGHSAIEQAVYNALWSRGKPDTEGSDTRTVHVGHAELMRHTSLVRNALKANLRSLANKQAIEMLNGYSPVDNRPSGYRVRGYRDILNRRKAAGMVYVVRGRSVRFCDEQGGELTPQRIIEPATSETRVGIPLPMGEPADELSRLADLLQGVVTMDTAARRELIAACRAELPSVRVEEIARAVAETTAKSQGSARNPTGFLLTVVPRQFEGKGIEQARARWAAEDRAAERATSDRVRRSAEDTAFVEREVLRLRQVLGNPLSSDADKADAAKLLKQIGR